MKKSTYVGIVIVILMIIVICIFAFFGNNKKVNDVLINETKLNEQNNIENEQINEQTNEVLANELVNETANEEVSNETENSVSSETFEESPKTAEEKAIDIAKKDWGENLNAEFSVEGIDGNGNYIVTVRNSQTTEALAFYTVNVGSQTFTKREMN